MTVVVIMNVSYPDSMPHVYPHLRTILRTSFLVLLMLGVMVRPMINQLSALHDVDHATLAGANDHGHDHPDDSNPTTDPDHATGAHGLMHQADTGTSANIWTAWVAPPVIPVDAKLPMADLASTRPQQLTSPFRPPIA